MLCLLYVEFSVLDIHVCIIGMMGPKHGSTISSSQLQRRWHVSQRVLQARMRNWLSKVSHQSPVTPNTNCFFCINKFYINHIYVYYINHIYKVHITHDWIFKFNAMEIKGVMIHYPCSPYFLEGYFCDRLIYLCRLIRVYLVFVSYSNTPPFWCIIN